jgi:hypothetical protein
LCGEKRCISTIRTYCVQLIFKYEEGIVIKYYEKNSFGPLAEGADSEVSKFPDVKRLGDQKSQKQNDILIIQFNLNL